MEWIKAVIRKTALHHSSKESISTLRPIDLYEYFFIEKSTTRVEPMKCRIEYSVSRLRNKAGPKNTLKMPIKIFARRIKATLSNMNIFEKISVS